MEARRLSVQIQRDEVSALARDIYISESGFDLETPKHKRMFDASLEVLASGEDGIDIRAKLICLPAGCFSDGKIVLGAESEGAAAAGALAGSETIFDEKVITANIFERIDEASVLAVYLYVITAGECGVAPDDNIVKQLYAFIWGTSYVDSGRIRLMDIIKGDALEALGSQAFELSDSICPGFYGMHPKQNAAIVDACGGAEIGVSVRESGVMLPVKTCSGVVFALKEGAGFDATPCAICTVSGGCRSCFVYKSRKRRAGTPSGGAS